MLLPPAVERPSAACRNLCLTCIPALLAARAGQACPRACQPARQGEDPDILQCGRRGGLCSGGSCRAVPRRDHPQADVNRRGPGRGAGAGLSGKAASHPTRRALPALGGRLQAMIIFCQNSVHFSQQTFLCRDHLSYSFPSLHCPRCQHKLPACLSVKDWRLVALLISNWNSSMN